MEPMPPISLLTFVIVLGVAVQLVAGVLAMQANNATTTVLVSISASVLTLGYAVVVSYRRGLKHRQSIQNPA